MKKTIVFFFCLFVIAEYAYPQQDNIYPAPRPKNCKVENSCPRNTLFHETTCRFDKLGFNRNSVNWDHILICRLRYLVSFRIGINYFAFKKTRAAGIPADINLMIGGGPLMFETGLGLNYMYIYRNYDEVTKTRFKDELSYPAATGRIGLRYQKQHSIFFRAGYTPMYSLMNNKKITVINKKGVAVVHDKLFYSMFGFGVGYTF